MRKRLPSASPSCQAALFSLKGKVSNHKEIFDEKRSVIPFPLPLARVPGMKECPSGQRAGTRTGRRAGQRVPRPVTAALLFADGSRHAALRPLLLPKRDFFGTIFVFQPSVFNPRPHVRPVVLRSSLPAAGSGGQDALPDLSFPALLRPGRRPRRPGALSGHLPAKPWLDAGQHRLRHDHRRSGGHGRHRAPAWLWASCWRACAGCRACTTPCTPWRTASPAALPAMHVERKRQ